MKKEVVIASAARTPTGKFGGALKDFSATQLGAIAIKEVLRRVRGSIPPSMVEEAIMGQVLQSGVGQAPARQAALYAGLPERCSAITVRKECASSLVAIDLACSRILSGDRNVVVAGGMESMSQAPYFLKRYFYPGEKNLGHKKIDSSILGYDFLYDSLLWDGLQDVYEAGRPHMGKLADLIAEKYEISRESQDSFALLSFDSAKYAKMNRNFQQEIVAVGSCSEDEGVRETSMEKLSSLRPAFRETGTITAGNASQLSDGAAALVLMSLSAAEKLEVQPMAKIIGRATYSLSPSEYPLAPIGAIKKVLEKCKLKVSDVGLFEINEAFAVVPLLAKQEFGITQRQLNIRGGAIALGHPLGASGARILTTLLYSMMFHKERYGIACACNGGGEAVAIAVENLTRQ